MLRSGHTLDTNFVGNPRPANSRVARSREIALEHKSIG